MLANHAGIKCFVVMISHAIMCDVSSSERPFV